MVLCAIDGNVVLAEPMKNKSEREMVETYQKQLKGSMMPEIFQKSIFWITEYPKDTRRQSKIIE